MNTGHLRQHGFDLVNAQYRRQTRRFFATDDIVQPRQIGLQHLLIQKQQSGQGLMLCRGGHIALRRQMRKKRRDLASPHFRGMPHTIESDKCAYPVDIRLFRP